MCTYWTDKQWEENSQPANPDSRYTLEDTRYNRSGQVARTYSYASRRVWYAVFPGYGNHPECRTREDALDLMAAQGYLEKPVTIAELIGPDPVPEPVELSGFRDPVENFS